MINYYNHFLIIKKIVLNFFGFLEKFYFLNNIRHKLMKDITLLNFFINSTLLLENHLKFNKTLSNKNLQPISKILEDN